VRGVDWGAIVSLGIIIGVLGTELLAISDSGRSVYPLARFLGTGRLRRSDWDALNSANVFLLGWRARFGDFSGGGALAYSRLEDLEGGMAVLKFAVRQIN
jgi:hypothetical protein